ncbi:hypothetical protein BAUCODRAFT_121045 [Baudoinia panamericana UAMH 10762]|uniref:C3H1-type domain-containing protein n=1 Tax=Baudoinia panamericana (strain UAMH 10762) TaxID=717646 RepID=M2NGM3_BAUPA|nr:uncharacterized protein BAUCODRAFT_121045 [Baudoinia panamericana UAMH 10762]EMC98150.1 hypothetical protein BAUCODRAFT_121045 [Baudoinia panamericana UAMH 10762]
MEKDAAVRFGPGGQYSSGSSPEHRRECPKWLQRGYCLDGEACKFWHGRQSSVNDRSSGQTKRHYSVDKLREIGLSCSTRLPPASAVQAMFLYELQRDVEVQQLFDYEMFRLARNEDAVNNTETRLDAVEAELKALNQVVTSREDEERIATSKARFDTQQAKLEDCKADLQANQNSITGLSAEVKKLQDAAAAEKEQPVKESEPEASTTTMRSEIDTLFDERDAMLDLIANGQARIEKLEDLVRQLTLQHATTASSTSGSSPKTKSVSPAQTQRIPLQTPNGQHVELAVPKGTGLTANGIAAARKENKLPPHLRAFTPGEQWAA